MRKENHALTTIWKKGYKGKVKLGSLHEIEQKKSLRNGYKLIKLDKCIMLVLKGFSRKEPKGLKLIQKVQNGFELD